MLRHTTLASAAVISAVCALEATVNEFHLDAIDRHEIFLGKAVGAASRIARLWDTVERAPILRKYEWLLDLAGAEPFAAGRAPYQPAADLIELRDVLVHYKPEWSDARNLSKRLEARLRSKFALNPLAAPDQFFIPYRCLGFGCAAWAVASSRALILSFFERLGVTPRLGGFDAELRID